MVILLSITTSKDIPMPLVIAIAGIAGLLVGSFLNVVIYRAPLGLSLSSPRSFCPSCRRQLTWWENIPVISWIGLRGHCRTCGQSISARYPLVELSTGISFALVAWAWHGTAVSVGYCCLSATMIAISLIEYGGKRAPLSVAAVGTGLGQISIVVAASWQHHWRITFGSLAGTVVALLIFSLLRVTDPECSDPRGFGRSAVIVAGCWMGGLGLRPAVVGVVTWIVAYFLSMVVARKLAGPAARSDDPTGASLEAHPVLAAPLVTALLLALAASLIVGG
jgi:leader peptidase (prepilin peptidase)/N-methyltransferase